MSKENLFEIASRMKLRFASPVGQIATEDLWGLPLTSKTKVNLNDLAKGINKQIREADEDDFVGEKSSGTEVLELKLDIIKHVIGVRQAENAEAKTARENKEKKAKLLEALAKKQDSAIDNMSEEEIQAELAKLG